MSGFNSNDDKLTPEELEEIKEFLRQQARLIIENFEVGDNK